MTYFNNLNHQYHRVIFEFTDKEMKDAGFHRTSKEPSVLEIIRLVRRIAEDRTIKGDKDSPEVVAKAKREVAKLQADMINSFRDEKEKPAPLFTMKLFADGESDIYFGEPPIIDGESMPLIITDKETMKISNVIELQDLQRKKDGWKAKALRLIGFLDNKDKENERLKEEKEWLLELYIKKMDNPYLSKRALLDEMQQALKDQP